MRHALAIALLAAAACAPAQTVPSSTAPSSLTPPPTCTPTRADVPANYKADAPVRNKIGAGGYVIEGIVLRLDCTPVAEARIEFWHVNADGNYDDDRRSDAARETMNADRFHDATLKPVRITGLTLPLPADGTFEFTLDSLMTVNGFEREVRWNVSAQRNGRDLNVNASAAFTFGFFGMEPPRPGPVLSIQDAIRMAIELSAKQRV